VALRSFAFGFESSVGIGCHARISRPRGEMHFPNCGLPLQLAGCLIFWTHRLYVKGIAPWTFRSSHKQRSGNSYMQHLDDRCVTVTISVPVCVCVCVCGQQVRFLRSENVPEMFMEIQFSWYITPCLLLNKYLNIYIMYTYIHIYTCKR
jgi:hypothetical protein